MDRLRKSEYFIETMSKIVDGIIYGDKDRSFCLFCKLARIIRGIKRCNISLDESGEGAIRDADKLCYIVRAKTGLNMSDDELWETALKFQ